MADRPPIPDWLLERVAVGETPAQHRDEIARRLTDDPELAARLEALRRSNDDLLAAHPPAVMAATIERRLAAETRATERARRTRSTWQWAGVGGALAAAAAALALVIGPGPDGPTVAEGPGPADSARPEITRAKGDPRLLVHRKRGGEVEALGRKSVVHAGDLLQLAYLAAGRTHGVVLSIDGAGAVTLHYPETVGGNTALEADGPVALPHAYELDDAPDFERFALITADHAIDVAAVVEHAHTLARDPARARTQPLPLNEDLEQRWFLLNKETER